MLTEKFLTDNEANSLLKGYKGVRLVSYLLLIVGIPLDIVIAYFGTQKMPELFLPMAGVFVGLLLIAYYFVFFKRLKLFKLDLEDQTKLVGDIKVISKSEKDKQFIVGFDSLDLEKLSLQKLIFDRINIGDTLYIEIARNSTYVFNMTKGDEQLVKCS